jgi:hypothetical protein
MFFEFSAAAPIARSSIDKQMRIFYSGSNK